MKHKHHDLIVQWTKDTSQKVWYYCEVIEEWVQSKNPTWCNNTNYKIQEEQPTEPPAKKV